MKQHLDEDDLILHFYGESSSTADLESSVDQHLGDCPECRERYQALQRVLNSADLGPVPYRGEDYGEQVWNQLAPKLGRRTWWSSWLAPKKWMPILAACALLVMAFFAGRYSQSPSAPVAAVDGGGNVRERVLIIAVGDHLERSKVLLVEIANADPLATFDHFDQRGIAEDLVYTNRLYRQTALTAGDGRMAALLEDLERVLIEIAHSPDDLRGARMQTLRERIRSEGLIFKIRVAGSKLAQGETL